MMNHTTEKQPKTPNFGDLPGLETVAREFAKTGARTDSHKNEARITAADIAAIAADVVAACNRAGVPQGEIAQIISDLTANIGEYGSKLSEIRTAALKNTDAAVQKAGEARAEMLEAKVVKLWDDVKQLNEEIKTDLKTLHKGGLISDEEHTELTKERERLDKLDVANPQRLPAEKALNQNIERIANKAATKANETGNTEGKKAADDLAKKAQQANKILDDIDKAITEKEARLTNHSVKNQKTSTETPLLKGVSSVSDDTNVTSQTISFSPVTTTGKGVRDIS